MVDFEIKNCLILEEFQEQNHYNSNIKNRKIDFPFVSVHCASFIKIGQFLS